MIGDARERAKAPGFARLCGTAPLREVFLCLALTTACAGEPPPGQPSAPSGPVELEPREPADPVEVVNSGRTLSGVYVLESPTPPVDAATWIFTDGGEFSRTRKLDRGRGERADSGTYVVDASGNLVLFVEKRGDVQLTGAERVTLALGGDPQTVITVTSSDGRSEVLARAANAPPAH